MQSRFSLHLCQGSCLPCAPKRCSLSAAAGSPAHPLTRSRISSSHIASRQTQSASPGSGSRRPHLLPPNVRYPPHLLPCRLGSGRPYSTAKHSICAPMPTRHPHGQPSLAMSPLLATPQDMPSHANTIHSGPMAQWRQSDSVLLRVRTPGFSRPHHSLGPIPKILPR